MNLFSGIGRIGRDAETRHTQSGTAVTSWPVAIDSGYGQNKKTEWFDCALWGERGEKLASYIRKGDRIGVQGEVSLDTYQARDGSEKSRLRLRVADVTLLGGKQDGGQRDGFETRGGAGSTRAPGQNRPQRASAAPAQEHRDDFEDGIPFVTCAGMF